MFSYFIVFCIEFGRNRKLPEGVFNFLLWLFKEDFCALVFALVLIFIAYLSFQSSESKELFIDYIGLLFEFYFATFKSLFSSYYYYYFDCSLFSDGNFLQSTDKKLFIFTSRLLATDGYSSRVLDYSYYLDSLSSFRALFEFKLLSISN